MKVGDKVMYPEIGTGKVVRIYPAGEFAHEYAVVDFDGGEIICNASRLIVIIEGEDERKEDGTHN